MSNFPQPQYLGNKYHLLSWIGEHIPHEINTFLDAFSASQTIAYHIKQRGVEVHTNDLLNHNHQIGLALIENNYICLTDEDVVFLISENKNKHNLIEKLYEDLFFDKQDCIFLDNLRANIELISCPYKKALVFSVINRSMTSKITMGHFAHTKAISYSNDPTRVKRNRLLKTPIKDIFLSNLIKYNQAVFNNKRENKSYNKDIIVLLDEIQNIDCVYFDPPYCDSHADYQSFYHVLETFVKYWDDKQFINSIKRYEPKYHSGFDKKKDIINSFNILFEKSENIPYWLMSYNDRSYPKIEVIKDLIEQFKTCEVIYRNYDNSRGGKGSVKNSNEILFKCY